MSYLSWGCSVSNKIGSRKLPRALPLGWAQPCKVDAIFFFQKITLIDIYSSNKRLLSTYYSPAMGL